MTRPGTVTWLRELAGRNGWRIDIVSLYDKRGEYLLCHCAESKAGTIRGLARKVARLRGDK